MPLYPAIKAIDRYVILFLLSLMTSAIHAAEVVSVSKKRAAIKVNAGLNEKFKRGALACVYTKTEEICGRIIRTNENECFIAIKPASEISKIKKGMTVTLGKKPSNKTAQISTLERRPYFGIAYKLGLFTPAKYNTLAYEDPTTQTADSLWSTDEKIGSSSIGFRFDFSYPFGESSSIDTILNYGIHTSMLKFNSKQTIKDFYRISDNTEQFINISQSGTVTGLALEYGYDIGFKNPGSFLKFTTGLDLTQSSISFLTYAYNPADESVQTPVTDLKSTISVMSLKLGSAFRFLLIGRLGLRFGMDLYVPLAKFGSTFSGESSDSQASVLGGEEDAAIDDAYEKLSHTKNSLGLDLIFATQFNF